MNDVINLRPPTALDNNINTSHGATSPHPVSVVVVGAAPPHPQGWISCRFFPYGWRLWGGGVESTPSNQCRSLRLFLPRKHVFVATSLTERGDQQVDHLYVCIYVVSHCFSVYFCLSNQIYCKNFQAILLGTKYFLALQLFSFLTFYFYP